MTSTSLVEAFKKSADSVHIQTHVQSFKAAVDRAITTFNIAYTGAPNAETRRALADEMGKFIVSIARRKAPNVGALTIFTECVESLVKNTVDKVDNRDLPADLPEKLTLAAIEMANTHGDYSFIRHAQKSGQRVAQAARKIIPVAPPPAQAPTDRIVTADPAANIVKRRTPEV